MAKEIDKIDKIYEEGSIDIQTQSNDRMTQDRSTQAIE
jgi:hypothetical protein